jgi:hypothetical protein
MLSLGGKIVGQRFHRLVVLSVAPSDSRQHSMVSCACDCGVVGSYRATRLISGNTKSCGCLRAESLRKSRGGKPRKSRVKASNQNYKLYPAECRTWRNMLTRCDSPLAINFSSYGGRGITVCEEWRDFDVFLSDMGRRPSESHSIDRIDNDKGYSRDNCRWATLAEQCRNRTDNVRLTINGETHILSDWCRKFGVNQATVTLRLKRGWDAERSVSQSTGRKPSV